MHRVIWLTTLLLLAGCTAEYAATRASDLKAYSEALAARGVSHCTFLQASIAPYGRGYLFAKTGDLNCEELWEHLLGFGY